MADKRINFSIGGIILWFGLGFLTHFIFIGPVIDWSSALSLFILFLWPLYLIVKGLILFFWLAVIIFTIGGSLLLCDYIKTTYMKE